MKPALTREEMIEKLPEMCMSRLPSDGSPILIKRGQEGYRPWHAYQPEFFNQTVKASPAQVSAMVAGSMFGWDVPGANPDNYDEDGKPITERKRRRPEQFPDNNTAG